MSRACRTDPIACSQAVDSIVILSKQNIAYILQPPQKEHLGYGADEPSDHHHSCGMSVTVTAKGHKLWPASSCNLVKALKAIADIGSLK